MRARALAISIALFAMPAAAGAEEEEPTPEEMAEARVHFEKAREHEDDGAYGAAADEYLNAYALYPDPEFFFNVGRVLRKAGNLGRALDYYERYLDLDPDGRGADAAEEQVEAIRAELDEEADPEVGDPAEDAREAEDTRDAPDDPGRLAPEEAAPPEPGRSRGMQIAGLATGAAGVVALGTSAYFGNRARSLSDEVSAFAADDPVQWSDDIIETYDDGRRADRRMLVLGGVGIAAVGAGTAIFLMAGTGSPDAGEVALSPSLEPGGAGVSVTGSF